MEELHGIDNIQMMSWSVIVGVPYNLSPTLQETCQKIFRVVLPVSTSSGWIDGCKAHQFNQSPCGQTEQSGVCHQAPLQWRYACWDQCAAQQLAQVKMSVKAS